MARIDVYQKVTDQIIEQLEQGVAPWVKTWAGPAMTWPRNGSTGRDYSGINVMICLAAQRTTGRWYSYRQAKLLDGQVRRGERSTKIVFFKSISERKDDAGEVERRGFAVARWSSMFNADQIDWPEESPHAVVPVAERDPTAAERCDYSHVAEFVLATGADVRTGGSRACYIPALDTIEVPASEAFTATEDFWSTMLHELTHWTGHASRTARLVADGTGKRTKGYAFEELVAELGSAFLCARLGIEGKLQHASYIDNWLQALKSDVRYVFKAASLAQKAVVYLEELVAEQRASETEAA